MPWSSQNNPWRTTADQPAPANAQRWIEIPPRTPDRSIGMAPEVHELLALLGIVFMTMQEPGDLRLQSGGVA
jgi:hypothetical protein